MVNKELNKKNTKKRKRESGTETNGKKQAVRRQCGVTHRDEKWKKKEVAHYGKVASW